MKSKFANVIQWLKGPKGRRLLLLAGVLVTLALVAKATGLTEYLDPDRLRESISGSGLVGALLLTLACVVGVLVQLPGMAFVAVAALAYGPLVGIAVGLFAAVAAVSVSFLVVRAVGGKVVKDSEQVQKPLLKKLLARLEDKPVCTVAALRLVFWVAPPLNYALALSNVRFDRYVVGSTVGLIAPVTVACLLVDQLF